MNNNTAFFLALDPYKNLCIVKEFSESDSFQEWLKRYDHETVYALKGSLLEKILREHAIFELKTT